MGDGTIQAILICEINVNTRGSSYLIVLWPIRKCHVGFEIYFEIQFGVFNIFLFTNNFERKDREDHVICVFRIDKLWNEVLMSNYDQGMEKRKQSSNKCLIEDNLLKI